MSRHVAGTPGSIRVQRFSRSFGGRTVLDKLDLEVEPGQFIALLGESGSGKTTLLRALAGLDPQPGASGRIAVEGNVSVLFQDARLLPWLSVIDNLTLGLEARVAAPAARQLLQEVGWPSSSRPGRPRSRAARSSAPRWHARCCATRTSCWLTNPSAHSTRSPVCACMACCSGSSSGCGQP